MEIITRKEAVKLGLKRYFTGNPCKRNHVSERLISDRTCLDCKHSHKKEYRLNNKGKTSAYDKKRYQENTLKENIRNKAYREANKKSIANRMSAWQKANKGKVTTYSAKRRATKLNATVTWSDKELIDAKYWYARFLTDTVGVEYHVDHIVPLQGKNVCGLHVENNLQVITAKENLSKGNKF